jgi:hypothetical protein
VPVTVSAESASAIAGEVFQFAPVALTWVAREGGE